MEPIGTDAQFYHFIENNSLNGIDKNNFSRLPKRAKFLAAPMKYSLNFWVNCCI